MSDSDRPGSDGPPRLRQSADAATRNLLEALDDERPSADARLRAMAALGLAAAKPPIARSWAATAAKLVLVLGAAASLWWWSHARSAPTSPTPSHAELPVASLDLAPAHIEPAVAPPRPSTPTPSPTHKHKSLTPPTEPTPAPTTVLAATEPATAAKPALSLGDEILVLDAAREAIAKKSYGAALALLDTHDAQFPAAALVPEATALRIEILVATGERERAVVLAARLDARYPHHSMATKIRELLQTQPTP